MNLSISRDRLAGTAGNFLEPHELDLLSPLRVCQQGLTHFSQSASKTNSLEQILRIFHKTIKIISLLLEKAGALLNKCSIQIEQSVEVLGVVQGVQLIQEFSCPDSQGLYLFQSASWQKCLGRGFLFGYNILSNLKLAEKLELIHLPEMTRIAIGSCSILRLATDVSYLFYRLSALSEGIRTGRLWQAAISVSKVFTTIFSLILRILNVRATLLVLALTCVSVLTDVSNLAKTEKWI